MPQYPDLDAVANAMLSVALGEHAGTFHRALELRRFLTADPETIPALNGAVHELIKANRRTVTEGAERAEVAAVQAASSETMASSKLAILNGMLTDHLTRLIIELEEILKAHDSKMGFTAPELFADRLTTTLNRVRDTLAEARGEAE